MNVVNIEHDIPLGMFIDDQVQICPSAVEDTLGIWSRVLIEAGQTFGPFEGERVQEAHSGMDPSYVWEIVDLETKEHLWYIDATDPSHGNWMRYIKSARFYEEQNIVSEQEGTDIFYRAIKDIEPGEELLTWYEKVELKGMKRKRKKAVTAKNRRSHSASTETNSNDGSEDYFPNKKTKTELGKKNPKTSAVSPVQIKPTRSSSRSKKNFQSPTLKTSNAEPSLIKKGSAMEILNDEPLEDGFYHFEILPHYEVKNKLGKTVYKCDICSAVYRHMFSLKRHYIRNHINIKYVSKADMLNCGITSQNKSANDNDDDKSAEVIQDDLDVEIVQPEIKVFNIQDDNLKINSADIPNRNCSDSNTKVQMSDKFETDIIDKNVESNTNLRDSNMLCSGDKYTDHSNEISGPNNQEQSDTADILVETSSECIDITDSVEQMDVCEKAPKTVNEAMTSFKDTEKTEPKSVITNESVQDNVVTTEPKCISSALSNQTAPNSSKTENQDDNQLNETNTGICEDKLTHEIDCKVKENIKSCNIDNQESTKLPVTVCDNQLTGGDNIENVKDSNLLKKPIVCNDYAANVGIAVDKHTEKHIISKVVDNSEIKCTASILPCPTQKPDKMSDTDVVHNKEVNVVSETENNSEIKDSIQISSDIDSGVVSEQVSENIFPGCDQIHENNSKTMKTVELELAPGNELNVKNTCDSKNDGNLIKMSPGFGKTSTSNENLSYDINISGKTDDDVSTEIQKDTNKSSSDCCSPNEESIQSAFSCKNVQPKQSENVKEEEKHLIKNEQLETQCFPDNSKNKPESNVHEELNNKAIPDHKPNQDSVDMEVLQSSSENRELDESTNIVDSSVTKNLNETSSANTKHDVAIKDEAITKTSIVDNDSNSGSKPVIVDNDSNSLTGSKPVIVDSDFNSRADSKLVIVDSDSNSRTGSKPVIVDSDSNSVSSSISSDIKVSSTAAGQSAGNTIDSNANEDNLSGDVESINFPTTNLDLPDVANKIDISPGQESPKKQHDEKDLDITVTVGSVKTDGKELILNKDQNLISKVKSSILLEVDRNKALMSYDTKLQELQNSIIICDKEPHDVDNRDEKSLDSTINIEINNESSKVPDVPEIKDKVVPPIKPLEKLVMTGLYRCNMCDVLYNTVNELKSHIQHHPPDPDLAVSCNHCDMKFTHKKHLMRHQVVHTATGNGKAHTCTFCGKNFCSSRNRKRHEKIHTGFRYICQHCATTFSQSTDLKKHIRRLHPTCYHPCAYCPKYHPNKKELKDHLLMHGKTLVENKYEINMTKDDDIQVIDPDLDKAESLKIAVEKYGESKDGNKYACTVCKKLFIDYTNMCRHRRLAHQRHLLDVVKTSIKRHYPIMNNQSIIRTRAAAERESDEFYTQVAVNIHDNLANHMMGTQSMIDKAQDIIKWDLKSKGTSFVVPKESTSPKPSFVIPMTVLNKYNFPKNFKWKDPNNRYFAVNKRSSRSYSVNESGTDTKKKKVPTATLR